ncbi:hypothetical protein BXZ70DRAFT_915767 [Cristinia sonorae]|uniref:Uncharacterized protein n=1 Tax=Cristinia sonorae TaxID=1940300 RepID=A0A8K0UYH0_9AGAR|nr:hypothetical protein BXZ70DRAFT_915767 [Cristinia sonorae]
MPSTYHLCALMLPGAVLSVVAQTSLYIPGFDPQPVTADVLGVGSDGRTTWKIAPGQSSGGLDDNGFVGTATLIEGSSDVQLFLSNSFNYLSESCAINNGVADCTFVAGSEGSTVSGADQEAVTPFAVQVGTSLPPAQSTGGSVSTNTGSESPQIPTTPSRSTIGSGITPPQTNTPSSIPTVAGAGTLSASLFAVGMTGLMTALSLL